MGLVAAAFDPKDFAAISAYFGAQTPAPGEPVKSKSGDLGKQSDG